MAAVNFVYDYYYAGYGEKGRYQAQWSESRVTLNGCYTYPMVFNNTVPGCKHIILDIEIENTGSGTIYNRSWDFMVCKSNGSWTEIMSFTLPETGTYTIDCDINNLSITKFAVVPSSNPGSSREWTNWYDVQSLTITESLEVLEPTTDMFLYGVFTNRYSSLYKDVSEVFVNIDGSLIRATDVLVNVEGTLKSVKPVYSAHYTSESDSTWLYGFTPDSDGTYRIREKRVSGDHEMHLYNSDFTEITDSYFYDKSFELTAGTLYYITVTHYYNADASESYLQIYKED